MKLKPTYPWRMYARPTRTMDPLLRDAVLLPTAPTSPLWDCPVPLRVYGFLVGEELGTLSCVSRAFSACLGLAEGTVRGLWMWIWMWIVDLSICLVPSNRRS